MKQKRTYWIVCAGIAVASFVVSFFLVWMFAPKTYTAKTVLLIRSNNSFLTDSQTADDILESVTMAQLLAEAGENQQTAQALIQRHSLPYTCEELLAAITVTHPENTMLLEFSFELNSPQEVLVVGQEYPATLIDVLQQSISFDGYEVVYRTQEPARNAVGQALGKAAIITAVAMGLLLFFVYLRPLKRKIVAAKKRFAYAKASNPFHIVLFRHWKSVLAVFLVALLVPFSAFCLYGDRNYESKSFLSVSMPKDIAQIKGNNIASIALAHAEDATFFTLFYQSLNEDLRNRYSEQEMRRIIQTEENVSIGIGFLTLTCHVNSQQDAIAITQAYSDFFCQILQSWCGYATYNTLGPPTVDTISHFWLNFGISTLVAVFFSYLYVSLLQWRCLLRHCRKPQSDSAK